MTKTLTEQWREGTLDFGYYYVKLPNERPQIYHSDHLKSLTAVRDAGRIEIIAPVPSYDEYKELLSHSELSRNLVYEVLVNQKEYNDLLDKEKEYKRLQEQKQKVIALIKDGRFVDALQELENNEIY